MELEMKKVNRKPQILIFVGLLTTSFVQIIQHYEIMPDFLYGSFLGIGIGISLLGVIKIIKNKKLNPITQK